MGSIGRHHHKVAGVGSDGAIVDVKQHRAAQHEIELSGAVMAVGRHPVAGLVDLQKQAHRFAGTAIVIAIGGCTEQSQAAVILRVQAKALKLLGVNDARQHDGGTV